LRLKLSMYSNVVLNVPSYKRESKEKGQGSERAETHGRRQKCTQTGVQEQVLAISMGEKHTLNVSIAVSSGLMPLMEERELVAPPEARRSNLADSATLVSDVGFMMAAMGATH